MNFYFRSEIALLLLWDNVTLNSDLKKKKKGHRHEVQNGRMPRSILDNTFHMLRSTPNGIFVSTHAQIHIQCFSGLVIEKLRVPARAAGEVSSPESILCADSYSVSVPPQCYRSGT